MDAKDQGEHTSVSKNTICRLEWIALAMDAARRHKEAEHLGAPRDEDPPRALDE
jgi:hypothetical protein